MSNLTQNAIIASFMKLISEKPFDKITVKDIVEDCNITRRTFYYHYQDMFALLEDILREETDAMVARYRGVSSWEDGFIAACHFILDNRQAVYHLYKSVHRPELERYIDSIASGVMDAFIADISRDIPADDADKRLVGSFYKYALIGLMHTWLEDGMREDADTIIHRIGKLFSGNIRLSLERSAQMKTGKEPKAL